MTSLKNAIGTIFSHNSIVELWKVDNKDPFYSDLAWKGMACEMPDKYLNTDKWKMLGLNNTNGVIDILIEETDQ